MPTNGRFYVLYDIKTITLIYHLTHVVLMYAALLWTSFHKVTKYVNHYSDLSYKCMAISLQVTALCDY